MCRKIHFERNFKNLPLSATNPLIHLEKFGEVSRVTALYVLLISIVLLRAIIFAGFGISRLLLGHIDCYGALNQASLQCKNGTYTDIMLTIDHTENSCSLNRPAKQCQWSSVTNKTQQLWWNSPKPSVLSADYMWKKLWGHISQKKTPKPNSIKLCVLQKYSYPFFTFYVAALR